MCCRLQRYGTFGRLKQAALRKVAQAAVASSGAALPEALRTSFAQLDKANTGRIPVTEILAELQGGHFQLTPEEAEQLMAQVDADSDGEVDWEEWVAVMSDWRTLKDTHEWDAFVEEAFKTLDRNADDALDASDLEVLLCGEEGCAAPAEVDSALREVDADHDGSVSLDEFKELLAEHNSDLMLFDSRVVEEGGKGGRR